MTTNFQNPTKPTPLVWLQDMTLAETQHYVVKGLLNRGELGALYGGTGVGKTFFVSDICMHVAMGRPWRGMKVARGPVLILGLEGPRGLQNRLIALRQKYELEIKDLGEDCALAVWDEAVNLCRPDCSDAHRLIDCISDKFAELPVLIVFDTLARAMGGGAENDGVDMNNYLKNSAVIQDAIGSHNLIVHHTGKDAERGMRGHTALPCAADTIIRVDRPAKGVATATVEKQRDGRDGARFHFNLDEIVLGTDDDGDAITTCLAVPVEDGG